MIPFPVMPVFLLCLLFLALGALIGMKIMDYGTPTAEELILKMAKLYSMGAKSIEKEAIERGYGEMYDKEPYPDKLPGYTLPSFRWIESKEINQNKPEAE